MHAGGLGIGRIAKRLNEEGIPAPRKSPRGWAPSAVHEMIRRPLYKGEIVWNEQQKIDRGGTKKRRRRDEKDLIRVDAPDLRIITPELWEKVQSRLTKTKGKGRSGNRDQDSKYLLTGMARCAHCGGPMTIVGADYHRRKGRFYGCSYYKSRGSSICKNSLLVEQDVLDQIVLKSIQDILTDKMLNVAIEKALAQHRAGDQAKLGRRIAVQRELSLIEAQLERLVDAVANGQKDRALFNRITAEEAKKDTLIAELEQLGKEQIVPHLDEARLKRELKSRLADIRALLSRHISYGRRLLRVLMESPMRCEAIGVGDRKEYRITGTGSYLRLLADSGCSVVNGVPNGIF
jgi:hypothetical protein